MGNPLKVILNKFFPSGIQTQNNNIDSQTFDPNLTHNVSMVSGFDGTHENLAIVDALGNLHVNSASGTVSVGYTPTVNITFPTPVSLVFLQFITNPAKLSFIDTTTNNLGAAFTLSAGNYTIPIVTNGIAFYCMTAGNTVSYMIMGYY
jgi:hypothetical protein